MMHWTDEATREELANYCKHAEAHQREQAAEIDQLKSKLSACTCYLVEQVGHSPRAPVERIVGRRPWWWKLNPWRALENRERAYAEALECLQQEATENARLRGACKLAQNTFEAYAASHREKGTADGDAKAELNAERARQMATALISPPNTRFSGGAGTPDERDND